MNKCVCPPEAGGKKENYPRPRRATGLIPQPPVDLSRGLQHHHDTYGEKGGTRRLDRDVKDFPSFIEAMEMVEIITINGQFTWNKKRNNHYQVATRLDRFLVSKYIILLGITLEYNILPWGGSDHWPVQLEENFQTTPKNRPFRFEKFWIDQPTFKENIKHWWREELPDQGTMMSKFIRDSSTSNTNLKSGTMKSLET